MIYIIKKYLPIGKYLFINYLSILFNVVLNVLALRYLTTIDLGRYGMMKSIGASLDLANMGTRYTIDRKVPECNSSISKTLFSIAIYINSLFGLLLIIAYSIYTKFDFLYIGFSVASLFFVNINIIRVFYRASGEINAFLRYTFLVNVFVYGVQIIGLYFYGLYGLVISYLITNTMLFIYGVKNEMFVSVRDINIKFYYYSIKKSFVVYLNSLFVFFTASFDRLFINEYSNISVLGNYTAITFFLSFLLIVPSSISELVYPNIIKVRNNRNKLLKVSLRCVMLISFVIVFVEILVYSLLPLITDLFFLKYHELISSMQLSTLAILPYCLIPILYYILFAMDRQKKILLSNFISVFLYYVFLYYILNYSFSYEKLALLKLLQSLIYMVVLLFFVIPIFVNINIKKN